MHIEMSRSIRRHAREMDRGLDVLNNAPSFWQTTMDVHQDWGILKLWTVLIDRDKKSPTLPGLVKICLRRPELLSNDAFTRRTSKNHPASPSQVRRWLDDRSPYDAEFLESLLAKLDSFADVTLAVAKWRNKRLAHADKSVVEERVNLAQDFPINIIRLEECFGVAGDVLNDVAAALGLGTFFMGSHINRQSDAGIVFTLLAVRSELQKREDSERAQLQRPTQNMPLPPNENPAAHGS